GGRRPAKSMRPLFFLLRGPSFPGQPRGRLRLPQPSWFIPPEPIVTDASAGQPARTPASTSSSLRKSCLAGHSVARLLEPAWSNRAASRDEARLRCGTVPCLYLPNAPHARESRRRHRLVTPGLRLTTHPAGD